MAALLARFGWKTLAGTLLLTAGQIAPAIPGLAPFAAALNAVGVALGGIGVIHKADKLAKAVLAAPAPEAPNAEAPGAPAVTAAPLF